MRVPISWLREFCPVAQSPEDLADLLTARGLKLERILRPWEGLDGLRVARVLDVRDHPGADKLCIATVDDGAAEREVVVGVRNMGPNDLVPYAPPGATLPSLEGKLERREIRGVTSGGMLCSPDELGIAPDHTRILVLPERMEPGADLKEELGLDETVLDIEVVPNRPDLLSVHGVAREAAAATGQDLVVPDVSVAEAGDAASSATVVVHDAGRCPDYLARVIRGVKVGHSPIHAQVRLTAAGMRPLSNVVDATNYVMLELGQPMHPFDLDRLAGREIVVRRAEAGERLVTLDDIERELSEEDLVIADHERGVGIAGIMGGGDSEVSSATSDVLLESAHFQSLGVLRTARRLGLRTEASIRFERGADPEGIDPAAARAARLISEWGGGEVLAGVIEVGSPPERRVVSLRRARASLVLGIDLDEPEIRGALGRLRLPATEEADRIVVEVPPHRVDLVREEDLIEEVGRTIGYDRVPSTLPGIRQAGGRPVQLRVRERVEDLLSGAGLLETRGVSFAAESDTALTAGVEAIRIANPISDEDGFLRTALLPGLLRTARRNVALRRTALRLFELGRVFTLVGTEPVEEERVAIALIGAAREGWPHEAQAQDFLDAKGILEHLLEGLGIGEWSLGHALERPWHPGRSAAVLCGGEVIGWLGELHPGVARDLDLPGRVAAVELAMPALVGAAVSDVVLADVSRFPPVHRDLAFLVDATAPAGHLRDLVAAAAGPLLERVVLFDVFEGEPLPAGKKSLAFALDLRAADRTLTDEEADEVVRSIAEHLRTETDAELRSGP